MEAEKLQKLHDTLLKLAPKGKFGGLGLSSLNKYARSKDPTLPDNPLYMNFVRYIILFVYHISYIYNDLVLFHLRISPYQSKVQVIFISGDSNW